MSSQVPANSVCCHLFDAIQVPVLPWVLYGLAPLGYNKKRGVYELKQVCLNSEVNAIPAADLQRAGR